MTFILHWRRDGSPAQPALIDRLAGGLHRLRNGPVSRWSRGDLTVLAFTHAPDVSISASPAGFVGLLAGRLDGFADLVAQLGGRAALGSEPTDAEVLAAAYEKWGERCFDHLFGDFAAAIWERSRRSLLCARDVVGIAPLYYWSSAREVVVAGQLGGVIAHPLVRREPNEGYIAEILADDIRSRHETLYQDVWRLVAGHAARFDLSGSPTIWRWGDIDPVDLPRHLRDEDYDNLYQSVLTEAISDRMRGPVKAGVELSGGLDSSTVAVLAAPLADHRYGEKLKSYSLTFPGLPCDESHHIRSITDSAKINPRMLICPALGGSHLEDDVAAFGDLPDPPNLTPWHSLYALARDDGISALLTGQGGDQWFDIGNRNPADLLRRGRLISAMAVTRHLSPGRPATIVLAGQVSRTVHRAVRRRPDRWLPPAWISSSLAGRGGLEDRLRPTPARRSRARQARTGTLHSGWEAWAHERRDLAGAHAGLRYSHPFYDARVVTFALGLPASQRWGAGQARLLQRRSMAARSPSSVWRRQTKADFSHLFVEAFEQAGGPRRFATLSIDTEAGWVNGPELLRRYEELAADVERAMSPRHIWPLWMALAVDSWYRHR